MSAPYLIVNPAGAGGRVGKRFVEVAAAVQRAVGPFEHAFTQKPEEATALARKAVQGGRRFIVAVGGDGTLSEVVDGLLQEGKPLAPDVVLGFLPFGTGGDLRRTLGFPSSAVEAASALASSSTQSCDVGLVTFTTPTGTRKLRHFINVADFGIGGKVVQEVSHGWKGLGGKAAFMLGSATALLKYSDQPVRYRLDDGPWQEDKLTALCVCNGRYFGGGMMVAPDAKLDDGLFDITLWKGLGFSDFAIRSQKLYNGSHVTLPNTRLMKAKRVEAEPLNGATVLLDVDGEQPGQLPATFQIIPAALRIRV